MNIENLMLFAAGKGTRMGALTEDRPKPMIEVHGKPLVQHALDLAFEAGFHNIVANVHYKPDPLIKFLKNAGVRISDERNRLLETGGGLRVSLPLFSPGPIATLNSDAIWTGENALTALCEAWRPEQRALLALVPKERAHGHSGSGDFSLSPNGELSREGPLVYTGAQILDPAELPQIEDDVFSLNAYWDYLAAKRPIYGHVISGQWCDVGHPSAIQIAETLLEEYERVSQK